MNESANDKRHLLFTFFWFMSLSTGDNKNAKSKVISACKVLRVEDHVLYTS